jgi:hypothetical protein
MESAVLSAVSHIASMGSSMVTIALLEASLNARMVRHLTANNASPISSPSVNQDLFSMATAYV